jgi:Spirocyclase AveC-like
MTNTGAAAASLQPRRTNPALLWALLGLAFFSFEIDVWLTWMSGPNFRPAPVDPASVPEFTKQVIHITQWISPIVTVCIVVKFLILPWVRERRPTTDGMLVIAYFFLWFQDPLGNLFSTQLYYSAYWVNMGSWTLGSFPGWISPNGNHLPEPILVMGFGYLWLGFCSALIACKTMQWTKSCFPRTSGLELILVALVVGIVLDVSAEVALMLAGTFAWPGAIKGITLFYGEPYQFPMTEGVLFGATIVSGGVLRYFRDDKGATLVERGIEQLRVGTGAKTTVKFFAIFGFMHLFMALVYSLPMAISSMYATVNQRFPAHLENNMCVVGPNYTTTRDLCPGPGMAMPRPPY